MKTQSTAVALAFLISITGWQTQAMAQATPPPQQPDQASTANPNNTKTLVVSGEQSVDESKTVTLSPFEVSADKDTGYTATDTLAGTRIRTNLNDVGAAITVLTQQFMTDVNATDINTMLQYTPNADVSGTEGTYAGLGNGASLDSTQALMNPSQDQRIRGLAAADNARDYYISDIPFDTYNVDRVDILRGPNAMLFGLGSPAGIVNNSTKVAGYINTGSVNFQVDNYGSVRSSLDLNQVLIPDQLAIRVDGLWYNQNYEQKQAFQDQRRIYGALRFDPAFLNKGPLRTSLKVNAERGTISADRPRVVPPNDSITPWWRPTAVSASNPFGGMGQLSVNNPYDPWLATNVTPGTDQGLVQAATVNFSPWISDQANQQQPIWFINGANNQFYQAYGGYINNGAVNSAGTFTGVGNGLVGKNTNGELFALGGLPAAAIGYKLPGYQYGQYRTQSLLDPSVFNYFDNLIDGPTASEWNGWDALNADLTMTAYDDRFGLDITYDRQTYHNGAQLLLGGSPTLSLDITKELADYYVTGANPEGGVTNPNYGRPFVAGAEGNGGSSYFSDREVKRASAYFELRPKDFTNNSFLLRLIGKQDFNGIASLEDYFNENRSWQLYANSEAWNGYWNDNSGAAETFSDRPPVGIIYLGNSVINSPAASGFNIPAISSNITLPSAGVYAFDTTFKGNVSPGAPYTLPSELSPAFNPATAITQASNILNYTGWNSNFQDNLQESNMGSNPNLLTLAEKSLRQTSTFAGSYQGFWWNDALVSTLGWRYDVVETKDVTAQQEPLNGSILNISPNVYNLPDYFPAAQVVKGHSTTNSEVLHLNRILQKDILPIDIALTFDNSSNFQVTSIRRDIYGNPIANPTGSTREYGAWIATKDDRFSLHIVKYDTKTDNDSAGLSDPNGLGAIVQQGLRYRNVFLYQLGGYTLNTANEPQGRNLWNDVYPAETPAQAQTEEDAAISTWNNIQTTLAAKGFFQAWNFNPTTPSVLTTRTMYAANPSAYQPNPATVYAYVATPPQGFTVTADTESKGYEYEFTANPLPNWRVGFNASETTAVLNNVGGATLDLYVNYINSQLINPDGTLTPAGKMAQFGNPAFALYPNVWAPFLADYQLLKLQEGTEVSELRKWHFNVYTNYTFDRGVLKGWGVGGGYRWEDKVVIGYPVTSTGTFDLNAPYYGPSQGLIDLWTSYERKLTKRIDWKIQLNIRNAFARNGLIPISVEPDGHTWASVRTKPIQEETLSNTFSF